MNIEQRILALEAVISQKTNVSVDAIRSRARSAQINHARELVWALAYDCLKLTYKQIAYVYDRDHTTIMSGYRAIHAKVNLVQVKKDINDTNPEVLKKTETMYSAKTRRK